MQIIEVCPRFPDLLVALGVSYDDALRLSRIDRNLSTEYSGAVMSGTISSLMTWSSQPEGHAYWNNLHDKAARLFFKYSGSSYEYNLNLLLKYIAPAYQIEIEIL